MALKITDACINCGACEAECPNHAIYEGGAAWTFSEGTNLKTIQQGEHLLQADLPQKPYSNDLFYIAPDKCTECVGFHQEPQCAAVCPVDCCVLDLAHRETEDELRHKKDFLHAK